jgi:hypothetical protein
MAAVVDGAQKLYFPQNEADLLLAMAGGPIGSTIFKGGKYFKKVAAGKWDEIVDTVAIKKLDDVNPKAVSTERSVVDQVANSQAKQVLQGGNSQAIAGHGEYIPGTGTFAVPNGVTIVAPRDGIKIHDVSGQVLETIDVDGFAVATPAKRLELIVEQLDALGETDPLIRIRVLDDLDDIQIAKTGDDIYNYTIKEPSDLTIFENSTTVSTPTLLDNLIEENAGCVALATCTK